MIPSRLKIALFIAILIFYTLVFWLLKKRRLNLKYTLLWLLTGVVLLILVIFPGIVQVICGFLGIQSGMNGLYIFLLAFIMMILMSITSIVSGQNAKIRKLTEINALMEKRIRELEDNREMVSEEKESEVAGRNLSRIK